MAVGYKAHVSFTQDILTSQPTAIISVQATWPVWSRLFLSKHKPESYTYIGMCECNPADDVSGLNYSNKGIKENIIQNVQSNTATIRSTIT